MVQDTANGAPFWNDIPTVPGGRADDYQSFMQDAENDTLICGAAKMGVDYTVTVTSSTEL
ncbi:MAG: hypothetical protein R3C56_04295 [Pirellulaceae bacterium]